jgi:uncharacterized membrane protein YeaQ/YmgE (transglycosylase-associated protein family)
MAAIGTISRWHRLKSPFRKLTNLLRARSIQRPLEGKEAHPYALHGRARVCNGRHRAVGLIAGWLAERITGRNHGLLTNLLVGVIGAFVGGFLFTTVLGFRYEAGFNLPSIVVATVGAVVLLALTSGFRTRRPWP